MTRELRAAERRLRAVAEGGFINIVYRKSPGDALEAFRADLLLLLNAELPA